MRRYLLPKEGRFYKANLHSHTILSDGNLTPEEAKKLYKDNGYSVLALTDHDFLHHQNHLTDDDFVMLTAYEINVRSFVSDPPRALSKAIHLNLFAKTPENDIFIGFHPETVRHLLNNGKLTEEEIGRVKYAGELRELIYSPEIVNGIIKSATENGYLVSLNHPSWSLINYSDYSEFNGVWAVEVYNSECEILGFPNDEHVYEDMLQLGKTVFCTAADDNHSSSSAFRGFTMIKAERLDYESIISAMEAGNFYASCGPEIHELYYENGRIHVSCSPAAQISLCTIGRRRKSINASKDELLTSAEFEIDPNLYGYIRLRITDTQKNIAWTNAYYVDELMEGAARIRKLPPDKR